MAPPLHIALLRAVNVGGTGKLKMAELKAAVEARGLCPFRTYIQSGNCIFAAPGGDPGPVLDAVLREEFGLEAGFVLLPAPRLDEILAALPEAGEGLDPKTVHIGFCDGPARLDAGEAEALRAPSERLRCDGDLVVLHAPDGVGRSKLFAKLPKMLGAPVTFRNLRTLGEVRRIAGEMAG